MLNISLDKASDFATLVIAFMTIVYTIGSLLLWIETRKVSRLARDEYVMAQRLSKGEIVSNLYDSHKDIYKLFLLDDELISLVEHDTDKKDFKSAILSILLINNVSRIFYHYKNGNIEKDIWNSVVDDTKEMFTWKIVKDRWEQSKDFAFQDFRYFIEKEILNNPS